jgi:predicted amidophosphoribosyltransferase
MHGGVRPDTGVERSWRRRVIDWLLPPLCLACQRTLAMPDQLCAACWRATAFITGPLCDRIGIPLPYDSGGIQVSAEAVANPPDYDRARAAAHFVGPARVLVHRLKYQDQLAPRRLLARWKALAVTCLRQRMCSYRCPSAASASCRAASIRRL